VDNDSVDVTSSGRSFQVCGPTTVNARLRNLVELDMQRLTTLVVVMQLKIKNLKDKFI